MSLEQNIAALTAAVETLNATILATTKLAPTGEPEAAAKTETKSAAKTETKPAAKKEEAKPAAKAAAAKKVTQEVMIATLTKLKEEHPKATGACLPIIKNIGKADKMKEIPEENFQAVYDATKAVLAALDEGGEEAADEKIAELTAGGDDEGM